LITNGILLGGEVRRGLVSLGLHRLWVSIDGAPPAAYRDVRIGDALPEVLENLAAFRSLRDASPGFGPRLGLVFVAMRRNVAQLPDVVKLGREAGMDRLLVTNVLAYTDDLKHEVPSDEGLAEIWSDPAYVELRQRLQAFDFSPCSSCNTCEMADDNRQDCSGSPHPACGGCLWAQGLIQCP
jgi:MoaA/NifB/PqqE/SkfB family radical SAM enzyme